MLTKTLGCICLMHKVIRFGQVALAREGTNGENVMYINDLLSKLLFPDVIKTTNKLYT
jgi:hypothetical protein